MTPAEDRRQLGLFAEAAPELVPPLRGKPPTQADLLSLLSRLPMPAQSLTHRRDKRAARHAVREVWAVWGALGGPLELTAKGRAVLERLSAVTGGRRGAVGRRALAQRVSAGRQKGRRS